MGKKRKSREYFVYECTLSGEKFKTTKKAPNPEELISVNSYYELHPDEDDRPEKVKQEIREKKNELEELRAQLSTPDESTDKK